MLCRDSSDVILDLHLDNRDAATVLADFLDEGLAIRVVVANVTRFG